MKVKCSCGAKYEFDVRPELRDSPAKFVCPACGLDASEFVEGLIRQELGQTSTPTGVPIPVLPPQLAPTPVEAPLRRSAEPPVRPQIPQHQTEPDSLDPATPPIEEAARCLKHPGELAIEKCRVCSKPICPKCMQLFGYVCSPLCKAKAGSHGIQVPVYHGQQSVVEARRWRKLVWTGTSAAVVLAVLAGLWFWYAWFGSSPRTIFSVRFSESAYSGQSMVCGPQNDQILFLHGATLARYDLKSGREIWWRQSTDPKQIQAAVEREMRATKVLIDKANSEASEHVPKMPSPEKLTRQMEREAAAALTLHVRGQNVWLASPEKLVRYDWETGKTLTDLPVQGGNGGLIARGGDELLLVESNSSPAIVTHVDLASGAMRREEVAGSPAGLLGQAAPGVRSELGKGSAAGAPHSSGQPMAGLPIGTPGKDAGKPLDPAKVAAQAQRLSLPERIALPATLAANINQGRALNELDDQHRPGPAAPPVSEAASSVSLISTKAGFIEFSVKLLESHIVARSAMKAGSGKSALEGNVTAGNSMEASNDLLNEMQRSNGGDIVQEDQSRYQVALCRPGSDAVWSGEVIGPPKLYPLETVNLLAADKLIIVLDKAGKKLWQSTLSFNVVGDNIALDPASSTYGQGPCVERNGSLYVFDEGVLSVFDLATGKARWRLPSVGIAGLFFDDHDMLYVNTTTASHESLKYSRQIDLSRKAVSVVLKLDSRNGKILWSAQPGGLINYVSGRLVLTAQSYMPQEEDEDNPYRVDTGFEKGPWLRIKRLNARTGSEVWEHFQERAPLDIAYNKNTIRLVFKKEVQVLKFPAF